MTPDPYHGNGGGPGNPRDPQSWNRYAYTRGDPVNRVDPSGFGDEPPCTADFCVTGTGTLEEDDEDGLPNPSALTGAQGYGWAGIIFPTSGGSYIASVFQWIDARATADAAAAKVAQISGDNLWSAGCEKDLGAVGVTNAQLEQAAQNVNFQNGYNNNTLVSSLYPSPANSSISPTLTVGQQFQNPTVNAEASLVSDTVFLSPGYFSSVSVYLASGTIMHELLHTITGQTDQTLESDLGITAPNGSVAITIKLLGDCFPGGFPQ
jgi:hypothetical protein